MIIFCVVKLSVDSIYNGLSHIVYHLVGHSGIYSYPEGGGHDTVGIGKLANDSVALARSSHLVEAGVLYKVTRKEHSRLNAVSLNVRNYLLAVYAFLTGDKEAEPGRIGIGTSLGKNELIGNALESRAQSLEILSAANHEGGEFLKLSATYSRLHIGCLEVVSEV